MIRGIGTDIIEIERIKKLLDNFGEKFISRCFTRNEVEYCQNAADTNLVTARFAVRFAGKEATAKALGTGFKSFGLKNIEIFAKENEMPEIRLNGKAKELAIRKKIDKMHISLSHEKRFAIAYVIAESFDVAR